MWKRIKDLDWFLIGEWAFAITFLAAAIFIGIVFYCGL